MTRERIDQLASTPGTLAHLVAEATDDLLDTPSAPGEWSARTILAHLRDDEYLCMRVCLERALAETNPEVTFINGADWEPTRNREHDRKEWLLADFALQRQASLNILHSLRASDWERRAHDAQHGEFSISGLVTSWIRHDANHIAQLERALGETVAEVLERRAHMAR